MLPATVADTAALLEAGGYVADAALATTVHLALAMRRPLFLEGEPGTGKTEIAKVLASGLGRRLVRLQCYDGLDLAAAAYEWDHARQLMAIRIAEAAGTADRAKLASDIYTRDFLQARPLLAAIDPDLPPAVLLIDELDRADEPFEAFLLEVLGDFQISIPEYGTVHARTPPVVVITSNRTREVHDAIRRRCLYHWVDYPDAARERRILARKAPGVPERLAAEIVAFVQTLRREDLFKLPGVAETIDWAAALSHLHRTELDPGAVDQTLGVLLKYQDDIARVKGAEAARLVAEARAAAAPATPFG
ncbi:carbon monoxide dehydrogenase D protein [Rhodovastum atsumiense]|uniref:MoxR family ATPase n=1 Tax=Rhodovastum atsumiense TaxID=504468 RepID=A0A5M6IKM4_9PROT|nr:MoxR family ATPase [Rhodovastum atsumiense]KAA5608732.1 MoxR family ATPase [Rhodovastum atsumiense]CAH2604954.1 carbon monoxide dehydrogenase D protein [Rhodovastum atsumiense]